jgi:hypothetical protein
MFLFGSFIAVMASLPGHPNRHGVRLARVLVT